MEGEMKDKNFFFESESKFGRGIEEAPVPIIIHAEDGEILKISKALTEITGYTLEDIPTIQSWAEKSYEGNEEEIQEAIKGMYCMKGSQHAGVFSVKTKSGNLRIWDFHTTNIGNISDGRSIIMNVALDITDKKMMEIEMVREKNLFKTTLSSVGDGVISYNENGKIILMNKVAESLTGWKFEEVIGRRFEDVFNVIDEFSREKKESIVNKVIESKRISGLEKNTILVSRDGSERLIENNAVPILNRKGELEGIVLIFREYSVIKQNLDQINYLNYRDQLTGLFNKDFYQEELLRLDIERNLPLSIIVGEISGLKLINDVFGHGMGDELLKKAAQLIKMGCRGDEIIARYGIDGFIVLLPKTDVAETDIIINRIKKIIEGDKLGDIDISITFVAGTKKVKNENMDEIFGKAEEELKQEKLIKDPNVEDKIINTILEKLHKKNTAEVVSRLSESMGREIGLNEEKILTLKKLGLLHDIGEIAIEKGILEKKGELTESERGEVNRHPEVGYRILSTVKDMTEMAEYVLYHHERWNGKGYPKGLKAEEIPIESRIIAIADAYEAMSSDRSYRGALPIKVVIDELEKNAGIQFDPELVFIFIKKVIGEEQKSGD